MGGIKKSIYIYRRLIKEIIYLKNNFSNWDSIIKRAINGKTPKMFNHRSGLQFIGNHMNTLSIFKEIFIKKVYSKGAVCVNENDIVFDIGANVGIFSLFASETKGTQVFAFEPHPSNFEVLENHVKINNKKNIKCLKYALGLNNEKRYMIEGVIPGGHIMTRNEVGQQSINDLTVDSVSLEYIMKVLKIDRIDFLKLDCEGAEGEVITSLGESGLKKIKKVAIEFHDNHSILNHFQILEFLDKAKFKTSLEWDGRSNFGYIYGIRNNL